MMSTRIGDAPSLPWYPRDADAVIRDDIETIADTCGPGLDRLAGKAVLITGASGFVGRYLVESIIHHASRGDDRCLLGLVSRSPETVLRRYAQQAEDGSVVALAWADRQIVDAGARQWDYIVHAAAPTDPGQYRRDPYGALRDIVEMAVAVTEVARASRSARILLVSSGAVYGPQPTDLPGLPETHLGAPDISEALSCYGEGKRLTELLGTLSGVDCRIARLFSLLGPYQDLGSSFAVPSIIRQASEDGAIRLTSDGSSIRNYTYSSDAAIALLGLLLGSPRRQAYNIGAVDGTVSIAEVAEMVSLIFGGIPVTLGQPSEADLARAERYVPALDRMVEEPAIESPRVGLREGLRRTCRSLHDRGIISRALTGDPAAPD